jgi:hypothetical protein
VGKWVNGVYIKFVLRGNFVLRLLDGILTCTTICDLDFGFHLDENLLAKLELNVFT